MRGMKLAPKTLRFASGAGEMFGADAKVVLTISAVAYAVDKANYRNLGHASASLRKRAIDSIDVSDQPSAPGQPPHTRKKALPRAIIYKVDQDGEAAIIGPRHSRFGEAAQYHEFGGARSGKDFIPTQFPPRPFMGPALNESTDRFAAEWENSIGG